MTYLGVSGVLHDANSFCCANVPPPPVAALSPPSAHGGCVNKTLFLRCSLGAAGGGATIMSGVDV